MRPRNGMLPVPEGPGLGVTLSRQGLDRCHARFLDAGPYDHYHDPAQPGCCRRLPLALRQAAGAGGRVHTGPGRRKKPGGDRPRLVLKIASTDAATIRRHQFM